MQLHRSSSLLFSLHCTHKRNHTLVLLLFVESYHPGGISRHRGRVITWPHRGRRDELSSSPFDGAFGSIELLELEAVDLFAAGKYDTRHKA